MKGDFRAATLDEYISWLRGWIKKGNAPTHYFDVPFSRIGFLFVRGGVQPGGRNWRSDKGDHCRQGWEARPQRGRLR